MSKTFILGPCAAESREQVLEIAESLTAQRSYSTQCGPTAQRSFSDSGLSGEASLIFRAGIWKPRTSPSSFQGVGEAGLPWLQEVQERYHLPVALEVATPDHVQAIFQRSGLTAQRSFSGSGLPAEGGLYLWLGARTSANPIAVQAIADALTSLPYEGKAGIGSVLIKNPVNEDVNLWIGNVERLQAAGVKVMAVHRGCNHQPCWSMAFEFRRRMPNVPLLLDPSHMSGDAAQVPALCQLAMDLDYDGLMIEVHNDPAHALSDAQQQITPAHALDIIKNLKYRTAQRSYSTQCDPSAQRSFSDSGLLELRSEIDEVDDRLWSLIAKRLEIAKRIGAYKKEHNLPVLQPARYNDILLRRLEWAKKNGIPQDTVQSIMEALHSASVQEQVTPPLS